MAKYALPTRHRSDIQHRGLREVGQIAHVFLIY